MNIPERAFDPAGRLSVMITSGRPSARSAASAMLLVLCAGCAAQPAPPPSSVSTPVRTHVSTFARTPSTAPTTQPATPPGPARPGTPRVLATGLDVPWDFAVLPDGSTLITLRDRAEVVRVTRGGDRQVVGRIDEARPKGEGGLLGLTLSPRFSTDGLVYVYYSAQQDNRVVRYRYAGNRLSAPRVVLAGIPRSSNHNGGRLRFGPDGMLYITTGDVTAKPPAMPKTSEAWLERYFGSPQQAGFHAETRSVTRCGPTATGMCRGSVGTPRDGCSPASSGATASTN